MKALVFKEYGEPLDVLKLEDIPTPQPKPDEVLIKIKACSINPSDLYTIRGQYGVKPRLPAIPGNEAAGVIEEIGSEIKNFKKGDRVTLNLGGAGTSGTWKEYITTKEEFLLHTPDGLSDEEATTAWANYITAWALVKDELNIQPNEKILITAGNSHFGRAMLQYAKEFGFQVVATVRKEDQKQELMELGALDVIVTDTEDLVKRSRKITELKGFPKAIDSIGGAIGSTVLSTLSPRGTMIMLGIMSNEPVSVSGVMIFTEVCLRGFWLLKWLKNTPPEKIKHAMNEISRLFREKKFVSHIDSRYKLEDYKEFLQKASGSGRKGKVVITP